MHYVVKLSDPVRDEALVRRIVALVQHQIQMMGGINCVDMNTTTFDADEVLYATKWVGQACELIKRAGEELDVDLYAIPRQYGVRTG